MKVKKKIQIINENSSVFYSLAAFLGCLIAIAFILIFHRLRPRAPIGDLPKPAGKLTLNCLPGKGTRKTFLDLEHWIHDDCPVDSKEYLCFPRDVGDWKVKHYRALSHWNLVRTLNGAPEILGFALSFYLQYNPPKKDA